MILRIGNETPPQSTVNPSTWPSALLRAGSPQKAFTLVEIMLTITILTVGIIGILRAYATSVNALEVSRDTVDAVCLLKEKMAEIEQAAIDEGGNSPGFSSGRFEDEFENFGWKLEVKTGSIEDLNEVTLVVSRVGQPRKFSLVTYAENK